MLINRSIAIAGKLSLAVISILLAANPAKADSYRFGRYGTGDYAIYTISLPAGQYRFHAYTTHSGDVDAGIGDMDMNPISNDNDEGSSSFQANLNGGSYHLAIDMHRCNRIFSNCEVFLDISRNGAEFDNADILKIADSADSGYGSAPSSPRREEYGCVYNPNTGAATSCGYN